LLKRRKVWDGIKTGGPSLFLGMSLAGDPFIGQVVPGVEAA
jgi:hypothetical protein